MKLADVRHALRPPEDEHFAAVKPRLEKLYASLENRTERYILGSRLINDLRIQGDINNSYAGDLTDLLRSATRNISGADLMRDAKTFLDKDIDRGLLDQLDSGPMRIKAIKLWVTNMMRDNDIGVATYEDFRDCLSLAVREG